MKPKIIQALNTCDCYWKSIFTLVNAFERDEIKKLKVLFAFFKKAKRDFMFIDQTWNNSGTKHLWLIL